MKCEKCGNTGEFRQKFKELWIRNITKEGEGYYFWVERQNLETVEQLGVCCSRCGNELPLTEELLHELSRVWVPEPNRLFMD